MREELKLVQYPRRQGKKYALDFMSLENAKKVQRFHGSFPMYEATFDLLYEEENAVGMVDFYGTEEHIIRFMKRPEMNVCTDGLLGGNPHPRVYGAFPRILGKYVREEKALILEEAVYKMTKKPADWQRA